MENACLLAVGDLHGKTDELFRLLEAEKPHGILGVGDWGDPGEVATSTWQSLLDKVPVLTVFGNHDDIPFLQTLSNHDGSNVLLGQGETRLFCGLTVAGVSGIWAKSHRLPHYVTDEDVAGWAETIAENGPVDILLTHGCPRGVVDRTLSGHPGGQPCFLNLLQTVRPHVYLCGHLHVAQSRVLREPPCSAFNTGALPDNHYVLVRKQGQSITAEAKVFRAV